MKIKKSELAKLWKILGTFQGKQKTKFGYFISKNKNKLKDEIDILDKLLTPSKAFQKYDQKRALLAEEMSDKNEDGSPVISAQNYVIIENKIKFDNAIVKLREENMDIIKEFEKQKNEYDEIIAEEMEFDGYRIKIDNLPDEIETHILDLFIETGLIEE